ncbi:hypothetical protein KAS45_04530 [candidate division WOR-3 bacterium]|nr:hypothetical protein [candidate division WOR-3 bacterium]
MNLRRALLSVSRQATTGVVFGLMNLFCLSRVCRGEFIDESCYGDFSNMPNELGNYAGGNWY